MASLSRFCTLLNSHQVDWGSASSEWCSVLRHCVPRKSSLVSQLPGGCHESWHASLLSVDPRTAVPRPLHLLQGACPLR